MKEYMAFIAKVNGDIITYLNRDQSNRYKFNNNEFYLIFEVPNDLLGCTYNKIHQYFYQNYSDYVSNYLKNIRKIYKSHFGEEPFDIDTEWRIIYDLPVEDDYIKYISCSKMLEDKKSS